MKTLILLIVASLSMATIADAHGGRTGKDGCHTERSTGKRHCH